MKLPNKLQNPFLLVGQGFVLGAILFFASLHQSGEARSTAAQDSVLVIAES